VIYRRRHLGELCRLVAGLLRTGFKAMEPRGQPSFILYVQTFGDLVTFNPHFHALLADGVFLPSGTFRVLPPLPEAELCEALRHKVFDFLCAERVLDAVLPVACASGVTPDFRFTIASAPRPPTPKVASASPAT